MSHPTRLVAVVRAHLDPGLDGAGTDRELIALFLEPSDASVFAAQQEALERDVWTAFNVRGPLELSRIAEQYGLSAATVADVRRELERGNRGPIRV